MHNGSNYEPYSLEVDPEDDDFDDYVLKKVEEAEDGSGWSCTSQDSTGFFIPRIAERRFGYGEVLREAAVPKVGDVVRVYGRFGRPMQGQVVAGQVVWYRLPKQREAHRRREREDRDARTNREFLLEKAELDKQYDALSEPFRKRLDRFRNEDPDFRKESERYESFICQQADLLITHFETAEKVQAWAALTEGESKEYDVQREQAPEGWSDGHSGNTWYGAVALACAVLEGREV